MLQKRQKVLARAPSTRDPKLPSRALSWTRFVAWKIICAVVISGVIMDLGGWLRSLGLYEAAFREKRDRRHSPAAL